MTDTKQEGQAEIPEALSREELERLRGLSRHHIDWAHFQSGYLSEGQYERLKALPALLAIAGRALDAEAKAAELMAEMSRVNDLCRQLQEQIAQGSVTAESVNKYACWLIRRIAQRALGIDELRESAEKGEMK